MIKSNFIPLGGQLTNWRTITPKNFSHFGLRAQSKASQPGDLLKGLGIPRKSDFEG